MGRIVSIAWTTRDRRDDFEIATTYQHLCVAAVTVALGLRGVRVVARGNQRAVEDPRPPAVQRRAVTKELREARCDRRDDAIAQVAEAAAATQARRDRARQVAGGVVATHGYKLTVEDTSVAAWSKSWGRALAAFSPGMLVSAIDREARAVAAIAGGEGGVSRAATHTTALSQHCPCGARVDKRLADRVHECHSCRLRGDRDAVSAVLASFVVLVRRGEPASARVDYDAAGDALGEIRRVLDPYLGWQDTLSESTDLSARDGSFVAWSTSTPDSVAVARRNVGMASCSTLNETGLRWTTSGRARRQTNMSFKDDPPWTYLRDTSLSSSRRRGRRARARA